MAFLSILGEAVSLLDAYLQTQMLALIYYFWQSSNKTWHGKGLGGAIHSMLLSRCQKNNQFLFFRYPVEVFIMQLQMSLQLQYINLQQILQQNIFLWKENLIG